LYVHGIIMTTDLSIERLARLFSDHPAWRAAARLLDPRATSTVFFRHRPGEAWHLERRGDETLLLPGAAEDPDFAFRFSPGAIDRLAAVSGNAGDFAAELFTLAYSKDPEVRVNIRVAAGFARLLRRGYVRLLIAAGPRARAIGFQHGETGMSSLQHLVASLRRLDRPEWEQPASGAEPAQPTPRRARRATARPSLHSGW
jgi:hypothetical protein